MRGAIIEAKEIIIKCEAQVTGFNGVMFSEGDQDDERTVQQVFGLFMTGLHGVAQLASHMARNEEVFEENVNLDYNMLANILGATSGSIEEELRKKGHLDCTCENAANQSIVKYTTLGFHEDMLN